MCSSGGLSDLKNEKAVVSLSFIQTGLSSSFSCHNLYLELSTGEIFQLLSLRPIYLLLHFLIHSKHSCLIWFLSFVMIPLCVANLFLTWGQLIWRSDFLYFPPIRKANTFVSLSPLVGAPSCGHWPRQPGKIASPGNYRNGRNPVPCGSASPSGSSSLVYCPYADVLAPALGDPQHPSTLPWLKDQEKV